MKKIPITPTRKSNSGTPDKDILMEETLQHINDVKLVTKLMTDTMMDSVLKHDYTKTEYFNEFYEAFLWHSMGARFTDSAWWEKHLAERHHLNDRVPNEVNLFDVLEMIADCICAGLARSGSVYDITIKPDVLQKAFENTVTFILQNVEVQNENK